MTKLPVIYSKFTYDLIVDGEPIVNFKGIVPLPARLDAALTNNGFTRVGDWEDDLLGSYFTTAIDTPQTS